MSGGLSGLRVVIAQLFPERLNLYGDTGNVRTLIQRSVWRGADVELRTIDTYADEDCLVGVDVIVAGGGPDADQVAVAHGLTRLGGALDEAVRSGASLLAICGAFQNLGHAYATVDGVVLKGPGLLDVRTAAPRSGRRMVGGVTAVLDAHSPIAVLGRASAAASGFAGQERTIVGFENHAGRTFVAAGAKPLGRVSIGQGNNGEDRSEGLLEGPGQGGIAGLRLASYLHGPLLPANPHVADYVLGAALVRKGVRELGLLDDHDEWAAHAANARRWNGRRAA